MREVKRNSQLLTFKLRGFGVGKRNSLLAYSFEVTFLIESPQSSQTNQTMLRRRLIQQANYEHCLLPKELNKHWKGYGETPTAADPTSSETSYRAISSVHVTLDHLSFAEYLG